MISLKYLFGYGAVIPAMSGVAHLKKNAKGKNPAITFRIKKYSDNRLVVGFLKYTNKAPANKKIKYCII